MSHAETLQSSIDKGLDRKALKTLKTRFLQVNNARLARTRSALTARQQVFLEILPMLFHVNHAILPGYVTHQTPCGLAGFNPTKKDIQKVQRIARSFAYRRQPTLDRSIYGIFLMGSCGTIAHSEKSDLDIWICHSSNLSIENKLQLRQKTDDISRWALSTGLEAHFFLMDDERFRAGDREELSSEDCGSSQHYLLLDEFYRTGLLIAGKIPIWWLIPPNEEKQYQYYAETLRKKRYIQPDETLDFGGIGVIPAGEFVGAGIWQLYKAIDSPYKSVLKILLTEIYAAEYPDIEPLSSHFKRAIYDNRLDIDELDPYVVVYRKLEQYLLSRGETQRLELVRRCFYFKVGKQLTRASRTNSKSWQRQLMEKLVEQWQWSHEHLRSLDARRHWKVQRVVDEQKELVRELTNSYRFVLDFARQTQVSAIINSHEMSILGRKLYSAFEKKAGKIEWINPGISPNLAEENLTLYQLANQHTNTHVWAVTDDAIDAIDLNNLSPLKLADELVAVLGWCHFNGVLDNATRIAIIEGDHSISEYELNSITRVLREHLPVALQYSDVNEAAHGRFENTMRPTHALLFINVGIDPLAQLKSQGIERLSGQTDSLGFSGLKENLVLNLEQITINNWGELSCKRYDHEHALMRCVKDYLAMVPPNGKIGPPQLLINCFCPTRSAAIAARVEQLFRDIAACYYTGTRPPQTRYIIEVQREYFILQFNQDLHPIVSLAINHADLLERLSKPQSRYSPIVLDKYCLQSSELRAISENSQAETIQIFFLKKDKFLQVYVNDEMGSLYHFDTEYFDEQTLLIPLDQFIQSTLFRRSSENNDPVDDLPAEFNLHNFDIEYYELIESTTGYRVARRHIIESNKKHRFMSVQVIGDQPTNNEILWTIYCDQEEFSESKYGKNLYNEVAAFILKKRRSDERYPCYITDLDLSRCMNSVSHIGPTQTVYYLRHKYSLENRLNSALLAL